MKMIRFRHLLESAIIVAVLVVWMPRDVRAGEIALNDLRTPSAPGFVILGVEPTSVERPMTPRSFAVSLASAAINPDALPRDYAIEASPYWLMPHDDLTYEDFYLNNALKNFYRNLSVSIAISKSEATADSLAADTRMGFGFRTLLFRGHDSQKIGEALEAMLDGKTRAEEDSIAREIKTMVENRKGNQPFGFSLEAAGAVALRYPGNDTEKGRAYRGGCWVTPTYRSASHAQIQYLGVFRWLMEDGVKPRYDLGFRFLWLATERLSMSAEYISRFGQIPDTEKEDTYRIAGVVDYHLDADMYLTATFGKNFQENAEGRDDLIARLGISFDFGDKPGIEIP